MTQPIKRLAGLCLVLAAVIAMEWLALTYGSIAGQDTEQKTLLQGSKADAPIAARSQSSPDYTKLDERPLFVPGRKPLPQTDVASEPLVDKSGASETMDARLMGVSLSSESAFALLADRQGKYHAVPLGGQWQGWELASVLKTKAVFTRFGRETSLELDTAPRPKIIRRTRQGR